VRAINCHACSLHARVHMHGSIPGLICAVVLYMQVELWISYVCGIVDLRADLLLGERAGASLPGLILIRCWTSLASTCVCRMCVRDRTLDWSASLLRWHQMQRLHTTTKVRLFFLLHCRHLLSMQITPWLRLGDYDSRRLDRGKPRTQCRASRISTRRTNLA
jgi:hypothetical protein